MIREKNKLILKSICFIVLILMQNYILITMLSLGDLSIDNFYCDAEIIGYKRYKADVNDEITFTCDIQDANLTYAIMGDGAPALIFTGSTFNYTYLFEGIYNVTLWAGSIIDDWLSDWLIIEIDNDAPEFDIGFSVVEYHEATYDFEVDTLGEAPNGWETYNDKKIFYASTYTHLVYGTTLSGDYTDLRVEDNVNWIVRTELDTWHVKSYFSIGIDIYSGYEDAFTPGYYKLFLSANDDVVVYDGISTFFVGDYCYGQTIYLDYHWIGIKYERYVDPSDGELFTVEIDWFKLEKIESEGVVVTKDVNDHGKIISLDYRNSTRYCGMVQNFIPKTFGTIEFWYITNDTSIETTFRLDDDQELIQKENSWFVNEVNITSEIGIIPISNEWYHIRIDWRDYNTPGYLDLDLGEFRIYVNNNPTMDFTLATLRNGVSLFAIETNGSISIDAIGFTWEGYNIGDNLNSIYLDHIYNDQEITFSAINMVESEIDKIGFGYHTDKDVGANYSYLWDYGDGNYSSEKRPSYRFSHPGDYPIRLTLVDDQGAMTTMVRHIIIENKNPISKITHGLNFDATFDFKEDLSGEHPLDWYTSGNVEVIDFKGKFSKVVEIDTTDGGLGMMSIPEAMRKTNDQVEFWVYFSDVSKDDFFFWAEPDYQLDDLDNPAPVHIAQCFRFGLIGGKWKNLVEISDQYYWFEMPELPAPQSNVWTHVSFLIDYRSRTYKISVNGEESNSYEHMGGGGFVPYRLGIYVEAYSHIYLDSIGFSWDEDYNIGDNNPVDFFSHYGTWDFRYYPNDVVPYDKDLGLSVLGPWIFTSNDFDKVADGCLAQIVPEIDGHYKILELQDNNNNDIIQASLIDLEKPKYGTIEFWIRTTDISQGLIIALGYQGFRTGIWLGNDGSWWYQKDSVKYRITDVSQMESNEWKHIRIDFDCRKDADYLGLSQNQFNFWVDGDISQLGPFNYDDSATNFQWNIWSTKEQGDNYSIYLDAVGVSWDPAYEIGDNLYPKEAIYSGTEIIFYAEGFDTISHRDNLKYFWNFGDNQTAFGETILHTYRKPGKYKIQLVTMDNSGYYSIDEDYIWIDNYYPNVDILKFTYGRTSYDFFDDQVGEVPEGWYISNYEKLFGRITEVVESVDDFYKVVKIGDGPGIGGIFTSNCSGLPYSTEPGDLNETYGTVEFWLYTNDTYESIIVFELFEKEWQNGIVVLHYNDTWVLRSENGLVPFEFSESWKLQNNTWTHFRIDFCCDDSYYMGLANDTFIIYADDIPSLVFNMSHISNPDLTNITCFGVWAYGTEGFTSVTYVDNFGFSWDPYYDVGDNRFAGEIIQFNEGDTIILECMSDDTYLDYLQLIYQWGYLFSDVDDLIDFGWHFPHLFLNDYDGDIIEDYSIISLVSDPYSAWDAAAYNMRISNVPPSYDVFNAQVLTNISATIYHSADYEANFTIYIVTDNETQEIHDIIFPSNATDNLLHYNLTLYNMELSKSWEIFVNQTGREGGEHTLTLYFQYSNGYEFSKSIVFNGSINTLNFSLNEFWINSETNMPEVPIIFNSYICDPSNDMVDLSIDYVIEVTYEVSYPSSSLSRSFAIDNEVTCNLHIKTEGGKKYAVFKFIKQIENTWEDLLLSKSFPVSYYINFIADMTNINIYDEIDVIFNSIANLNQLELNKTYYYIYTDYIDGDYDAISQSYNIGFQINSKFEFDNLAPSVFFNLPYNLTEDNTYEFLAEIDDFNEDNLTIYYMFGMNSGKGQFEYTPIYLGNNIYGLNHTYTEAGNYIFTVIASDGIVESKVIQSIEILNQAPYAKIRTFVNATYEDDFLKFEAEIFDTDSDIESLRFYWDFGDGTLSPENPATHAFSKSGEYMVRLFVKDDNGELFIAHYTITILDKPPEIIGPFSFIGIEGQTTVLDVEVTDSISDSIMTYTWDIYEAYKIYNATYNFLNVSEGDLPGFPFTDFRIEENITYQVTDYLAGHVKVLQMEDLNNLTDGYWIMKYGNTGTTSGSVEFWLRASYLNPEVSNFEINLFENETGIIPLSVSGNGTWVIQNLYTGNSSQINNLPQFIPNHWHHIRIDYECAGGNYLGLAQNEWRLVVDGISSPNLTLQFGNPPNDSVNFLDTLKISSSIKEDIIIYCDAIGYSNVSTYYRVNDNINQKILSHKYIKTIYDLHPPLALNEGTYIINLKVENDAYSEQEITLEVQNLAPIISTPSKRYSGCPGYIEISTYCREAIIDVETIEYEWRVNNQKLLIKQGTLSSSINVFCNSSGIIKGHVLARDSSDLFGSQEFFIRVFIDSNGDGFSNEYEELFGITDTDQDGDNLPNFLEFSVLGTNMSMWDTDQDGLCDGWDNSTRVGEFTVGTNATNPDTDNDNLLDGFEWFGWNVTHIINKKKINKFFTSDPLKPDTDGDGLLDYYEFTNRTDPNLPDTDGDGLLDLEEIEVYKSDPTNPDTDNDGLLDSVEINIGTYFDNPDSDGDGIQDGVEYLGYNHRTNPLCKDTDRDYLPDNEEIINYHYEMEGRMNVQNYPFINFRIRGITSAIKAQLSFVLTYGENCSTENLSDFYLIISHLGTRSKVFTKYYSMNATERYVSEVVNIKDIIENAGREYYGGYCMYAFFSNPIHGDLCCEEFSLDISTYLDPDNSDYDNDGILDGVESSLLVSGDAYSYYDDIINLTADTNSTTYDRYQFEISDIGLINDAELWFNIISNETLSGNGNVVIKVIKKAIAYGASDTLVLTSTKSFSTSDDFSEFYNKNLFDIFSNDSYGKYEIIIDIYDSDNADVFNLINLTLRIGGYRKATYSDTEAWITKPELADTDGDGWSDKYEIYDRLEPTNPVAWDTDGDGVKDSKDWDPLHNIVLEVRFLEGSLSSISYDRAKKLKSWNSRPKLQMVVLFDYKGGDGAYVSKPIKCSESTRYKEAFLRPTISYKSRANFDNLYYIDIEDDQRNYKLDFELWDYMNGEPDFSYEKRLIPSSMLGLGASWHMDFNNYERDKEYQIESWASRPKLKASVTTRGLRHSNTIALYHNETLFNGHYNDKDRYHVIQVNIIDTPSSESHFIQGVNTIVIPNSAFMKSSLSSLIQNSSALKNSFLAYGHFITIDRSDLPAKASNKVETVFNLDLTWLQAEDLLVLAITGIINDTTGEIGVINDYASTKHNNTKAEMMNLPQDALYIIPFITPFTPTKDNADRMPIQGRHTTKSYGIILDFFITNFGVIFDAAAVAFEVIIKIIKIVGDVLGKVIEIVFAFGTWVAEQAVKTALLILIYAMHAIQLAVAAVVVGLMSGVFSIISLFLDVTVSSSVDSIQMQGAVSFSLGYEEGKIYNSYLDTNIPTIESSFSSNDFSFSILSYYFDTDIDIDDFPGDFWGHLSSGDALDKVLMIMNSMSTSMMVCGGGFNAIAYTLGVRNTKTDAGSSFMAATIVWFTSLAISISAIMAEPDLKAEAQIGVGLALMISGITVFSTRKFLANKEIGEARDFKDNLKQFRDVLEGVNEFIELFGPDIEFTSLVDNLNEEDQDILLATAGFNTFISFVGLLIGSVSLQLIPDPTDRKMATYMFGFLNLAIGLGLFISATKLNE